jgi:arginine deiminase
MENELDLDNLTKEDFMEMATYVAHVERERVAMFEELKKTKAYLTATLQQRNSAEQKYQNLLAQKSQQTIPLTEVTVINTELDLINPEQWAVPKGKVITTPKSNKI